jgi:nucleoside 2-deoxyribosyltransferase
MTLHVAGGVYREWCDEGPIADSWDELLGSGLRAASALISTGPLLLHGYIGSGDRERADILSASRGVPVRLVEIADTIQFAYTHALARPLITPALRSIVPAPALHVDGDVVLRFGMLEGTAIVKAERAVYDPQSAYAPEPFAANGSRAGQWVLVANALEVRLLTGTNDMDTAANQLLRSGAYAVVVKQGAAGLSLYTAKGSERVPAYRSSRIWPIGTGDVFSAVFTHAWGRERASLLEATDLASRGVAAYSESPSALPLQLAAVRSTPRIPLIPGNMCGRVYLAGPFFNMAQRWLVNESRRSLLDLGCLVFSPLHDVGRGAADEVAPADIAGLEQCKAVLALVDGSDSGTLFEAGYARANNIPVVAFIQQEPEEALTMLRGTGCDLTDSFATAIYRAAWAAWQA